MSRPVDLKARRLVSEGRGPILTDVAESVRATINGECPVIQTSSVTLLDELPELY